MRLGSAASKKRTQRQDVHRIMVVRYFGSETTVVTTSHSSPPGTAKRSKYSVIVAPSL